MASSTTLFMCLVLIICSLAQLVPFSKFYIPVPVDAAPPKAASQSGKSAADESQSTTPQSTDGTLGSSTTTTTVPTSTVEDSTTIDFTSYQNTSTFTCNGKVTGYYADVKLHCRVYHFCTQLDGLDGPSYQRMSYLCLEDSFFDQKDLNCVRESDMKIPCSKAEEEYEMSNKQFDAKEEGPSMSDSLAANIMMNPIARFIAGR